MASHFAMASMKIACSTQRPAPLAGRRRPAVPAARTVVAESAAVAPETLERESGIVGAALQAEKQGWQETVRTLQGRRKHRFWEPALRNPPPLLADVCVVLVSPKRPISVGTVARSLSCFECEDLRIVEPRCDHLARSSRNGSKGAQWLLWKAAQHASLAEALADVDLVVACTRWVAGRPNAFRSISELLAHPQVAAQLAAPAESSSSSTDAPSSSSSSSSGSTDGGGLQQPAARRPKLAFVFGREVEGLLPAEVDACDFTLSIPIGRLQESMSLSHAVSVVLSRLFEQRQQASGHALPQGVADLAAGWEDSGVER
ncbi:hypothetical protein ABPG75_008013 [Micractinium tetrahymenae]